MVFVSYSRADISDVRPIVDRLRRDGVDCWFDESHIPVGEAFVVQLGEGLARADAFVLIDTPASRLSYWVKRESTLAFRLRNQRRAFVVARMFAPGLAESCESWGFSAPLTLGGQEQLFDFLRTEAIPLAPDELAQVLARTSLREGHFGQPQNWSGRQEELERLDSWWLGLRAGAWILGLGGSGKSGLVQTWVTALDHLGYDRGESVAILFIVGREITNSAQSDALLKDFLGKTTGIQRTVVVLDGFDEASDVVSAEQLLHEAVTRGARVLVSSRSEVPEALFGSFVTIDLSVMPRRDTVAYLSQRGIEGEDALAVAEELGDHPLAVLLFSRYVASHNLRPAEALRQLRLERHDRNILGDAHERTVSSIGMTVKRAIGSVSPPAQKLLSSLCRTDGTDLKWPECLPPSITASDALTGVRELMAAGLLEVDRLNEPTQLAIHDLVRDFVRRQIEVDHGAPLSGRGDR